MSSDQNTATADELWAALWECLQATGADTSAYTDDVWTKEGRAAGLEEFKRSGTPAEVVAAVEAMDDDTLTIEEDVYIKLICPETGCAPADICAQCGRSTLSGEGEGCYDCRDGFGGECWVKGWVENLTADELLHGSITLPVQAVFDGEVTRLEILTEANADA